MYEKIDTFPISTTDAKQYGNKRNYGKEESEATQGKNR